MRVNYELLDCGDSRKLEKFGDLIIDRPAPQAVWSKKLGPQTWDKAGIIFESAWRLNIDAVPDDWNFTASLKNRTLVNMRLFLSEHGQIGVFPEQLTNWEWLYAKVKEAEADPVKIMNGFAYTGASTLFCSVAGAEELVHVDSSKPAINAARFNAGICGIDSGIRFMCEDMITFMAREHKRGNRYNAIVLDPPAFGRGGKGKTWKLKRDLQELLEYTAGLLSDSPLFILLTCHDPEVTVKKAESLLNSVVSGRFGTDSQIGFKSDVFENVIKSENGNSLPCGISARVVFNYRIT